MGTTVNSPAVAGVLGFYTDPNQLLKAMPSVRDAGYEIFDAFTPFAVHGLDDAMGLQRSPIPYVTFCAGLVGAAFGFGYQYWTSAVDWAINVGGKPFNSWPAFVPVMFECTILFAGLSTFAAMIFFNKLPNHKQRSFDPALTNDRFAIFIGKPCDSDDDDELARRAKFKPFDESEAKKLLESLGATGVRVVHEEGWFQS